LKGLFNCLRQYGKYVAGTFLKRRDDPQGVACVRQSGQIGSGLHLFFSKAKALPYNWGFKANRLCDEGIR